MSDQTNLIFCPRCGASGQRVDSYCRSCGEWLPDPQALGRRGMRLRSLSPERRLRKIRALELGSALSALAAALILIAAQSGAFLKDLSAIAIVLCIEIVVFQLIAFNLGRGTQSGPKHEGAGGRREPNQLGAEAERVALGPANTGELVRPPSVTENTTALLEPLPRRAARGEAKGE